MHRKTITIIILITTLFSCQPGNEKEILVTQELNKNWEFRQINTDTWLPAVVPGSVHSDLMKNQIIEDPFYRLNEERLQWIDKTDWEYRTVFFADDEVLNRERNELVFEGLDTYAQVFLNDEMVLQADNMFRTWVVDISGKLKKGENELVILFESPTRKGLEALQAFGFQLAADNDQSEAGEMGGDRVSPYIRKAPYHFGWDWGPRLVTSGIWRPVLLRAWSTGRLNGIHLVSENINEQVAELSAEVDIEALEPGDYSVKVLTSPDDNFQRISVPPQRISVKLIKGDNKINIPVTIEKPELWQPNSYGDQVMYRCQFELYKGKKLIDSKIETTGLRNARLVREADPDGTGDSFYFEINGKPVFAKGANYIPNDVFLDRVSPEKYEYIVKSAADANMNMLRVWGGGIYEDDLFYDLCDRYGIMVWQDFMFACAMYPGNDEFLESVRQEATDNVRRLRNHPCIVLWCGNNEIEAAWGPYDENRGWGWKQRYKEEQRAVIWKAYDTLFHKILPAVITEEDPERPYWHSSPSAGMGKLASYDTRSGDIHYWGVWHGLHPFTDFRKYKGRFMSEYGFQSFPEFNSVKKYTLPEDHDIESEVMMAHQRSGIGNLRIRQYMAEDYRVPQDFEQFLYVGQLLQAEAIRVAIESHRADMPYCMGSLYWQLNDCWPVASWSGIDYYGRWKALHYFVKEAFKPSVLVVSEENDSLRVKVVSDQGEIGNWKLEIRLVDFSGAVLNEISTLSDKVIFNSSDFLGKADRSSVVLVSKLIKENEIIDTDLHYFVNPKVLKLVDPQLNMNIVEKGDLFELNISAKYLAKNVFLYADGLEEQFSDNYFDILPGENITVTIPKKSYSLTALESLRTQHLYLTMISLNGPLTTNPNK